MSCILAVLASSEMMASMGLKITYFICKMTTINFDMFNCLNQRFPECKWCPTCMRVKTGYFKLGKLLSGNLRGSKLLIYLPQNTSYHPGVCMYLIL